ncbi:hypothetical protein JNW88_01040 [Micromonospora sp. ATA32]|nr:hypothetical protein [Micromonospora sp. ATA32]
MSSRTRHTFLALSRVRQRSRHRPLPGDDAQRGLYRLQLVEFEAYGAQVKP